MSHKTKDSRSTFVHLRVSEREKAALRREARQAKKRLSDLLRERVFPPQPNAA